jgi:hypothetical protein
MPEELSIDESEAFRLLTKAQADELQRLKREHQEICRDVRKRLRGQARQSMLRYHDVVFRMKVRRLLGLDEKQA